MHFLSCSHEKLIDFLEFFFRADPVFQGNYCVEPLNAILREQGIGYEFTPLIERDSGPGDLFGRPGGRKIEYEYPQAIRKSDEYVHQAIVRPCLDALAGPAYATAHGEMMAAHEAYRQGNYPAEITACGSAFESVLKTMCNRKAIAYDAKDTCGPLVQKCRAGGLFPPFYVEAFKAVGTLRNNLSTAHGRGPTSTARGFAGTGGSHDSDGIGAYHTAGEAGPLASDAETRAGGARPGDGIEGMNLEELNRLALPHTAEISRTTVALFKHVSGDADHYGSGVLLQVEVTRDFW